MNDKATASKLGLVPSPRGLYRLYSSRITSKKKAIRDEYGRHDNMRIQPSCSPTKSHHIHAIVMVSLHAFSGPPAKQELLGLHQSRCNGVHSKTVKNVFQ